MTPARQQANDRRPGPALPARRREIADLLDDVRPASARTVLATALIGAEQPRLPVASLVAVASLFGISSGAARTCLWRMAADGDLETDRATYALAGRLLDRRERVDSASRVDHTPGPWDGTWELYVVNLDRRQAMDRLDLRKATSVLHLAEIREGVWTRPDNLPPDREAAARAVVDQQCVQYRAATSNISHDTVAELFQLPRWADTARRLLAAMESELSAAPYDDDEPGAILSHQFTLSMAVVAHLERDPLLPAGLLPEEWPAERLRTAYRRFDRSFQRTMNLAMRQPATGPPKGSRS